METVLEEGKTAHELLIRLDERTKGMAAILATLPNSYVAKPEFEAVKKVVESFPSEYVKNESFLPISKGFYAIVGLMCLAVIGALLSVVVK